MDTLYHYCSNETFLSIISNRSIRLSLMSLSNDHMEGKWVRHAFNELCEKEGLNKSVIGSLNSMWDSVEKIVGGMGFCLSENGDLLSQWRGYADQARGVSIGFNYDNLDLLSTKSKSQKDIPFKLKKILYEEKDQHKILMRMFTDVSVQIQNGALNYPWRPTALGAGDPESEKKERTRVEGAHKLLSDRFKNIMNHLYDLKNPAFSEEREWRLLSLITMPVEIDGSYVMELSMLNKCEFRNAGDYFVPFLEVDLTDQNPPIFNKIVLGPKNTTPINIIKGMLQKHGFDDVIVRRSKATLR